ncbi:hypothetical protein [Luteolibacter soli]|uniref:Uncharacterized protein n=1 Tax=Luteolibacter soli TaxID=3135280 RepID=A0ABU9B1I9_9BACT
MFILLSALLVLTRSESITEINAATGNIRTRTTVAWLWKGAWKESSTWVSERAKHLKVPTENKWQTLGIVRQFGTSISRGCNRAPVSYLLTNLREEAVAEGQRDEFVRQFAGATENEREEILRQLLRGESLSSTHPKLIE